MIRLRKIQELDGVISASRKHFYGDASPHLHEFFEIEFVIDGSGKCIVDGQEYELKKNTLFLLSPANTHEIRKANAELINVMFLCDSKQRLFSQLLMSHDHSICFEFDDNDGAFLYSLLSELVSIHKDDVEYALMLLDCVLHKLDRVESYGNQTVLPYVQKAILYVTENFRNCITLSDTAAHLGLSSPYLSDLFVKHIGVNFKVYLDNVRFSHAKNLLTFTDLQISEICRNSGFEDYANFSRRFKHICGMTPTEYRKRTKDREF
ncbi:MAG: helix-turn-helix domain-containing protein [Clostridia bacterium]|nr:helix-turn-helix domain-containing protein [Clostridia bacterium]